MTSKKILLASLALVSLAACQPNQDDQANEKDNEVAYVQSDQAKDDHDHDHHHDADGHDHDHDHDEAHGQEVVVKILADAYVTAHGDHFHTYSGKLPADALISKDLLVADYSDDQVVSDLEGGHVVKQGEDYLVYLDKGQEADQVRDLAAEASDQAEE